MTSSSLPDGVISQIQRALEPPDLSGTRYTLKRELGRGGMGIVYEVEDAVLQRPLALKVMNEERMWREARLIAGLEHPGIVPVHDAGRLADGRVFYAMKLVRGERLDGWMSREPGVAARLSVFVRMCDPVAFAHARGIAHGDLKPANVMIGSFGEVLVLDWGAAGGTPGYMPPEPNGGVRGDVYSLGRLLLSLAGRSAPAPVRSICAKATASDPADRYAEAAELSADVARHLAGERVSAHREQIHERIGRLASRHRALVAIVAAYLLMRAALIFLSPGP
jgi:serine/threonine protein kinase